MNSNDVQDLTDIRPRIMFAVVAVCFLTLAGIFYFFTEADNAKVDAAEVLTSNYSSNLSVETTSLGGGGNGGFLKI